ncbi:Leucine-rich repeat, typical subtype, partial [Trema orientale]
EMPYCKLKQLWHGVQQLGNLKHINLMHSEHLTQMPDLSCAPKLETINLQYCTSLLHVPSLSFPTFNKPTSEGRTFLRTLRDPATLILNGCSSLKSLPNISGSMKYLHLSYTAIEELPTSILSLDDLTLLDLTGCNLKNLPNNISKLGSLKDLYLRNCSSFNKFPELPRNIVKLDLSGTAIEQVPSSIKHVSTLQELHLMNCTRLMNLSTSICELKHLRDLSLLRCSKLENFPEILEPMESLGSLDLRETGITGLPRFSLVNLITLRSLFLDDCENLASVPHSIFCISSLQRLSLSNCPRVELLAPMSQICSHRLKELNMSNCSALELPDWFGCLSSLEILDLRGNHFDTIPKSIKNIPWLIELQISNCKNLRSLPDLPLSVGFLDASGCTSLETVSNSKTNIVQGHWNDYHVTLHKEFLFSDCSKLDQNARDNIMTESYIRILRAVILSVLEPGEKFYLLNEKPSVSICCPGNEIPKWFSDQYAKSSVTIKLTPDWHENFIGFALSAIVAFEDCYFEGVSIELRCQFYFKTKYGESGKFLCSFEEFWDLELQNEFTILNSDHVFMWYKHEDYHDYLDAVEVTFDFLLREFDHDGLHISSCNNKFRNCGVRLLYVQDAEGFGIDSNPRPFVEQDDIFDEAEPGGDETIDFDTDEPHPKRTKLSNL